MSKDTHTFSAVQENIRAQEVKSRNERWMSRRPQLCWKCQKDKPLKGGSLKFFGSIRRFICVDCVLTKQVEIAREKGESK